MKKLASVLVLLSMLTPYSHVFANMNIVYNTEYIQNIETSLKWNDISTVKTSQPDKSSFTIDINYDVNKEEELAIYMQQDEEPEKKIAGVTLLPNKKKTSFTYKFPTMKYGIYKLKIRAELKGTTVNSWDETLVVMRMYEPQFLEEFSTTGVCAHIGRDDNWALEGIMDLFKAAGIMHNRGGHTWYKVEGKNAPGVFQKSDVVKNDSHKFAEAYAKEGGQTLSVIQGMPECWYNGENSTWNSLPTTPKSIEGYSSYVAKIMGWYPDELDTIEYLNEPNKPAANYPAADYTNLVTRSTVALAKAGYEGNIDAFSFYPFRAIEWAQENYDGGIYPYMTAISAHAYGFGSGPQCADKGTCEKELIKQYDNIILYGGWKDIDWTETGAPNTQGGSGISEHATALKNLKDKLMSDRYNVIGYYLYDLINDGVVPTDKEQMFGLVRATAEGRIPKPQYLTYANQNIELNGAFLIGRLDMGDLKDEITAYIYIKEGKPLLIAWDRNIEDGIERQMQIQGETVELIDIFGNNDGTVSDVIQLHEEPYFVHGLSDSWFNKAVSYEVSLKNKNWLEKYDEALAEGIDAKSVLENAQSKLAGEITADEVKAVMESYTNLGLEILEAGKNGKHTEVEVSRMLYQLYEIMIYIGRFYAGVYDGEVPANLETDIKSAEARARNMYWDDFYMMQYSNEILKHARRNYYNAEKVLRSDEQNSGKAGIVAAWDMVSGQLVKWFNAFTEYEHAYNFGLISHVFVKADSYIETAYSGENKEVEMLVINDGYEVFDGKVQVVDEAGEEVYVSEHMTVAPGNQNAVTLKFQIMKHEDTDMRRFTFNFIDDSGYLQKQRTHAFEVKPMVETQILDCHVAPEELKNVQIKLKNLFDLSYDINIKLETSDNLILSTDSLNISLAPNEEKTVDIPVVEIENTKFHHYTVKYSVYDEDDSKIIEDNVPLSFTPIVKATEPIDPAKWDGDVSDWYDAYPIYRNHAEDPNDPEQYVNANMSIRIMNKWDDKHLYILADVYDSVHTSMSSGSQLWDGDCVQISIDPLNDGSITTGPSERYKDDDFEIGFGFTGAGEEFYQWRGPSSIPAGKVEWAKIIRNYDVGYTRYLIALDAEKFNIKMGEGNTVTFNVAVNEADALGREFFYQITNGTADSKTPEWYYDYKLVQPTGKGYVEHSSENIFTIK